jgi:transcriptional regulator with XRE-family HTH domain
LIERRLTTPESSASLRTVSTQEVPQKLGPVLQAARQKHGWSLRQLGERLRKEDGSSFSPQYLNDIEHGRRTPPSDLVTQIAGLLSLDPQVLLALAGHEPPEVKEYLAEMPEQGETIGRLFRKARERGFKDWNTLLLEIEKKR